MIYHYTGYEGLYGILKNKHIYMSSHKDLSDYSEIYYGLQIFHNYVIEFYPKFKQRSREIETYLECYDFWITSFCKNKDSLTAWLTHGNDGAGFAIGFKANSLIPTSEDSSAYYEADIIYHEAEDGKIPNVIKEIKEFDTPVIELIKKLSIIKHSAFKDERESRIILHHTLTDFTDKQNFVYHDVPKNDKFVESLQRRYLPFGPEKICEIIVGPRCHFQHAKESITSLLNENDYDTDKISIRRSTIPYHTPYSVNLDNEQTFHLRNLLKHYCPGQDSNL